MVSPGSGGRSTADGIALEPRLESGPIGHTYVTANRVNGPGGDGVVIRRNRGQAMIKSNVIDGVGSGGLVMEDDASG